MFKRTDFASGRSVRTATVRSVSNHVPDCFPGLNVREKGKFQPKKQPHSRGFVPPINFKRASKASLFSFNENGEEGEVSYPSQPPQLRIKKTESCERERTPHYTVSSPFKISYLFSPPYLFRFYLFPELIQPATRVKITEYEEKRNN